MSKFPLLAVILALTFASRADTVRVHSVAELQAAVSTAKPGARIEIAPGDYAGNLYFTDLRGEIGKPIVIAGADPAKPPHFTGGGNGLQLVNPFHVELRDLKFTAATGNGVSIDDGGRYVATPRGLVLHGLRISDVGPRGNHDAIKLSGLTGFRVEQCVLENWGTGNGSGIDMVGCHSGVLSGNTLRHLADQQATGGSGMQAKGGCRDITIRGNRFEHAGQRAVNLGGSTGLPYFRPPLDQWPGTERWEAAEILVEGNTFLGSGAPIAFVGSDGGIVRFNTFVDPGRWVIRILQETKAPGFIPARRGKFTDNIIVFRSDAWASGGVNIGGGTAPDTFEFARNVWFCRDRPDRSKPALPAPERDGLYGTDPQLGENHRLAPGSPVRDRGAEAVGENSKSEAGNPKQIQK